MKRSPSWLLCLLICLTGIISLLFFVVVQAVDQVGWRMYYSDTIDLGQQCEIAQGTWSGSFDAIREDRLSFRPQKLPYRGTGTEPTIAPGEFFFGRCTTSFDPKSLDGYPRVSLGPIFGHSRIYVNSRLVVEATEDGDIIFPLTPDDVGLGKIDLKIISLRTIYPAPGPCSLRPMFLTAKRSVMGMIDRYDMSFAREQPAYRAGFAGVALILLLALYLSGLKYKDVLWLAAFSASICLQALTHYLYNFDIVASFVSRTESVAGVIQWLCLWSFLYHVCSRDGKSRLIENSLIGIAIFASALIAASSEELFYSYRLLWRGPSILGICVLIALMTYLWRRPVAIEGMARIRKYLFVGSLVMIITIAEILFEDVFALYIRPVTQVLCLFLFVSVLVYDLTRRQYEFFTEKSARVTSENEARQAAAFVNSIKMLIHDIKRPFNLMRFYLSQESSQAGLKEKGEFETKLTPTILQTARYLERLLSDISSIGKRIDAPMESIDLKLVVRDALLTVATNLKKELIVHDHLQNAAVKGDRASIRRLFENIIENATHAAAPGGTLTFTSSANHNGSLKISVHNTGKAIPEEERKKIFDIFYTSDHVKGSGLGLAIVKQVVEAHGGTVICESDTQGTSFSFDLNYLGEVEASYNELPKRVGEAAKSETGTEDSAPLVCLVDDDEMMIFAWKIALKSTPTATFKSSLSLLSEIKLRPSKFEKTIFVFDYFLNDGTTGFSLADAVKSVLPHAKIFICSDYLPTTEAVPTSVQRIIDKSPMSYDRLSNL